MNEETIIENRYSNEQPENNKKNGRWKHVVLGGVPGILMGAGLMYSGQAASKTNVDNQKVDDLAVENPIADESAVENPTVENPTTDEHSAEGGTTAPVSTVSDDLSFGEAFYAARAAVGPGGVFEWHGGLYNTYTIEEWNAMSALQKNEFAQHVSPITPASHVSTPTDANPHVVIVHDAIPVHEPTYHEDGVVIVDSHDVNINIESVPNNQALESENVHIVGYDSASDRHIVVDYDTLSNDQADVTIIDVSQPVATLDEIIVEEEYNVGDYRDVQEQNRYVSDENPNVDSDQEEYVSDVTPDVDPDISDYTDDIIMDV